MPDPSAEPTKHYVRFRATEAALDRSAKLYYGHISAIRDSLLDQWMVFYVICFTMCAGFPIHKTIKEGEFLPPNYLFLGLGILIIAPLGIRRFLGTYRILRHGIAVVGIVISDSDDSPFNKPLFGKGTPSKQKGLRMTYAYRFKGERYTGVTGDTSIKKSGGTQGIALNSAPDSTGECKIILIDPDNPDIDRSTPEDIVLDKAVRKRVSEELGLICLA